MALFPRKRLAKGPIVSFVIETFVETIEATSEEYLVETFQILLSLLFSLLFKTLLLVLKWRGFSRPEVFEYPVWKNHNTGIILWLIHINVFLHRLVHVLQHFESRGACCFFQVLENVRFLVHYIIAQLFYERLYLWLGGVKTWFLWLGTWAFSFWLFQWQLFERFQQSFWAFSQLDQNFQYQGICEHLSHLFSFLSSIAFFIGLNFFLFIRISPYVTNGSVKDRPNFFIKHIGVDFLIVILLILILILIRRFRIIFSQFLKLGHFTSQFILQVIFLFVKSFQLLLRNSELRLWIWIIRF